MSEEKKSNLIPVFILAPPKEGTTVKEFLGDIKPSGKGFSFASPEEFRDNYNAVSLGHRRIGVSELLMGSWCAKWSDNGERV